MSKVYSLDDEYFAYECLGDLIRDAELDVGTTVYVGDTSSIKNRHLFDADDLIDMLADRMYDQVGECADGWGFITNEQKVELNKEISAMIDKYFPHNFYRVVNVQEYVITKEDME